MVHNLFPFMTTYHTEEDTFKALRRSSFTEVHTGVVQLRMRQLDDPFVSEDCIEKRIKMYGWTKEDYERERTIRSFLPPYNRK